jgi:hypothetical protein
MSLNRRGKIVGQVVHPRPAASDRKQGRRSTPHPHSRVPPQDIIEISSDEDEEAHPPPRKSPTNPFFVPSTNEPDYSHLRQSQKDKEIEKLKKVRRLPLFRSPHRLISRGTEGKGIGTSCCEAKERNRGKEVSSCSRMPKPYFPSVSPARTHLSLES